MTLLVRFSLYGVRDDLVKVLELISQVRTLYRIILVAMLLSMNLGPRETCR